MRMIEVAWIGILGNGDTTLEILNVMYVQNAYSSRLPTSGLVDISCESLAKTSLLGCPIPT